MQYVTLNNGVKMPQLGYGVYQVSQKECERCVLDAIGAGYRSIDTAQSYGNEAAVGSAVKRCGVPRDELFLTTKVWMSNAGYEKAKASIDKSLRNLQTDYIDLLLIHQPFGVYYGTWRAMEEAYHAGKLRAIGVSNFYPDRLIDLCQFAETTPAVNQVETHVFQQQRTAHDYMKKYGVQHEFLGPICRGPQGLLHQSHPGGDRGKVRQIPRPDRAAVFAPVGRGGHPQVHPPGPDGGKSEGVRLLPLSRGHGGHSGAGPGESLFFSHYDPATVEMLTNMGKTRIV